MELKTNNDLSAISLLPDFLRSVAGTYGISEKLLPTLNLAIEEAMTNVVSYAYDKGTVGEIRLNATYDAQLCELRFTLTDHGAPFDPTAAPDADTTLTAQERPIGGLGIFLVRQLMDRMEYRREGDDNVLTMCKHVEPAH